MGTYKVQPNGSAPQGLSAGDKVVTGGGTYKITGVKPDGSYTSTLVDKNSTTYNYGGTYDQGGGTSIVISDDLPGSLQQRTNATTAEEARAAEAAMLEQLLEQIEGTTYQPSVNAKSAQLSFEDALKVAQKALAPQFESAYRSSAQQAAQRLDKSGLYDTLYGQALSAQADRDVTRDLNSAAGQLALQMSQNSAGNAYNLLKLATEDKQFAATQNSAQVKQIIQLLLELMVN